FGEHDPGRYGARPLPTVEVGGNQQDLLRVGSGRLHHVGVDDDAVGVAAGVAAAPVATTGDEDKFGVVGGAEDLFDGRVVGRVGRNLADGEEAFAVGTTQEDTDLIARFEVADVVEDGR